MLGLFLLSSIIFKNSSLDLSAPGGSFDIEVVARNENISDGQNSNSASSLPPSARSSPKSKTKKQPSLKDLGFDSGYARTLARNYRAEFKNEVGNEWTKSDSYGVNDLTAYADIPMDEVRFLGSLWNQVNKSIVSPPFLSEYGQLGRIHFQFVVDGDGRLRNDSLRVRGENRILKVIAARALRKVIHEENHEMIKLGRPMKINAQFTWTHRRDCYNLQGVQKTFLSFCQHAENLRKTFSSGEKAATYLQALQYGTGAIEEIKKYRREEMRRNTGFDPFEDYRRDPDWDLGA